MSDTLKFTSLDHIARPSVADQVFDALHKQVLALDLPPGTKMSEADVARQMGVSRQPVRDAFYRLSKLGFLSIRPQRATTVSQISSAAVMQARFIRSAIEVETARIACDRLTEADHKALRLLLDRQQVTVDAGDPVGFHALDDQFHREICQRSGCGFAWEIIHEHKSHMDRVRFLSLAFASNDAFEDHVRLLDAIVARDMTVASDVMRLHLSRIKDQMTRIRSDHAAFFAAEEPWSVDL
jgi:DNA-binding GntR family transcriptional regulator